MVGGRPQFQYYNQGEGELAISSNRVGAWEGEVEGYKHCCKIPGPIGSEERSTVKLTFPIPDKKGY